MSVLSSARRRSAGPPSPPATPADEELSVVPARHLWRWVFTAVVIVLVAQLAHGLATNPGWDWATFSGYFFERSVIHALLVTLELTGAGAALGFVGGIVLAAMRLSKNPVLHTVSWLYTWVFRSVPLIVQLLFWANLGYLYSTLQIGIPFGPGIVHFETLHLVSSIGAALLGRPTPARSSGPASSRSTRASSRPPRRSASRADASSAGSCCRRPCGRSCPARRTSWSTS